MLRLKKAAMFGLDARVALAIFGSLSVVSGALLFDALDDVDSTALIEEMNQASKAYSQYYLHTRKELPLIDKINLNAAALVDKTIENLSSWRGPYLQYNASKFGSAAINVNLVHPLYGTEVFYTKAKNSNWTSTLTDNLKCISKTDCAVWVRFDDVDSDVANAVDEIVDTTKNSLAGNIRMESVAGNKKNVYFYVKRTKDIRQGAQIY